MNQTGVCQTVNEEKSVDDAPKAQQTLFFFFSRLAEKTFIQDSNLNLLKTKLELPRQDLVKFTSISVYSHHYT